MKRQRLALLCFLVAGCAVQLSPELQLDNFSKDPDTVNVTGVPGVVTCDMTIPDGAGGAGGGSPNVVKYAACSFKSPDGRKQGCLATSEELDVWSCDVTIPADSEGSASPGTTWVLEYVFAESEDGAKLFATGAEIQADQVDGEIDLKVISDAADTTAPNILTFNAVPANVEPGSTVTCTLTTDEDPIELMGCSFVPDDASASVSCISAPGANQCQTTIPAGATPGVTYNEINHFARDKALNVTVADASKTFVVGAPPTTGQINVDYALLDPACSQASWSIATSPGGAFVQAGAGTVNGIIVDPGDYTITWGDSALACTVPTVSPETKTVTGGGTTTFDLSTDYTVRSTFASVNTDVGLDGDYGAAPPGGGAWTMESDLLPAQFAASGTGDVTGVVPSQGNFYVGRAYTLTWAPVLDHDTPATNAITTSGTYQGNYVDQGGAQCGGKTPDLSVTGPDNWVSSAQQTLADALLTFTVYAKSSAVQSIVAISSDPSTTFGDNTMLVRWNSSGNFDAYDAVFGNYTSDNTISAPLDTWHKIIITADVNAETYSVSIGVCDDAPQTLITDASFRVSGPIGTGMDYFNLWSLTGTIDTEGAVWTPGACTPTETCISEGYVCGTPLDDCGDPLPSCGTCTGGDVCFPEGTCCTPSLQATACSGLECGNVSDGCGGTHNCGTCTGGEVCNGSNLCVEGGNLGDPYVHVYPADVGVTIGVGVTAPVPTVVYSGPNPITSNGTTVENVIINSCLTISADNVTIRNVIVNCTDFFGVRFIGASNVTFENNKVTMALPSADKSFYIDENNTNLFIRKNDIGGGQDFFFSGNNNSEIYVEFNYLHDVIGSVDSHADAFQWWPDVGNGAFYIRGNYIRANNETIGYTGVFFSGDGATTNYTWESNNIGLWDIFPIRYYAYSNQFVFRYNVYAQAYKTGLPANGPNDPVAAILYDPENGGAAPLGAYRCNRYEDGDFIEEQYLDILAGSLTHDISSCPTYPP